MRKKTIREVIVNGNKYFVYDMEVDKNSKRKRIYGKTRGEVEEKIELERMNRAVVLSKDAKTFRDVCDTFFDYCVGKIPPYTLTMYKSYATHRLSQAFLDSEIDVMSTKDFEVELSIISESCDETLLMNIYEFLKDAVAFAQSFDRMPFVRTDRISLPEVKIIEYKVTDLDYERIKAECIKKQSPSLLAILFIGELGLRVTEVCSLVWDNVNDGFTTLSFERKTGFCTLKLNEALQTALRALQGQYDFAEDDNGNEICLAKPEDPLFLNRTGENITTTGLQKALQVVCLHSGASTRITLNGLREYRGRKMIDEGATIEQVNDALGFSSLAYAKSVFSDYMNEKLFIEVLDKNVDDETKNRLLEYLNGIKKKP